MTQVMYHNRAHPTPYLTGALQSFALYYPLRYGVLSSGDNIQFLFLKDYNRYIFLCQHIRNNFLNAQKYKNDGKQRIYVVCHRLCFILFILIVLSVSLQSSDLCFQSVDFSHLGNIDFIILCLLRLKFLLLLSFL